MDVTVNLGYPVGLSRALSPHRRGPGDPAHRQTPDGALWRCSLMPSGAVTYRLSRVGNDAHCEAWGPGAAELLETVPALVGGLDDPSGFAPEHPILKEAHRRFPHFRIGRTDRVMEAMVPAILEQKVHGTSAFAAWRYLLRQFGQPPPGPAPEGMRVPPSPDVWRRVPSWEFHRANVDPKRAKTIVLATRMADKLEAVTSMNREDAERRLRLVPGVGLWTAAEVTQRALGDTDALSVGDYHLATVVGRTLRGAPMSDDEMIAYMEPLRPHRYRAVRLLEISGTAQRPRFGPRTQITDHRGH